MAKALTAIDLSRVPAPAAIEPLDFEVLNTAFAARVQAAWAELRAAEPTLPEFDTDWLQSSEVALLREAWSYLRLLDRQRVNDAIKAVLAPFATGTDLDNVVARANILRAEGESDAALLRRYVLSFDAPSAGSRDAYLFRAFTAWPTMHDAAVIGRAIHGRRGDVDVVITGTGGAAPTTHQVNLVRAAVSADDAKPEATSVTVIGAVRNVYSVALVLEVPQGPDPEAVRTEALARVLAATAERNFIGASVPAERISGAAYGPNVIKVRREAPLQDVASDSYAIPVCGSISITVEVVG
jgi:phage-related baseplate assembly protein